MALEIVKIPALDPADLGTLDVSVDLLLMVDVSDTSRDPLGTAKKITIKDLAGKIEHNSLSGVSSNRHIDHSAVSINTGTGLTGGGNITATRTIALNSTTITSLSKADSAVQPSLTITAGTGLAGGGDLSANRTISLSADSIASLALADTAIQDLGDLGITATATEINVLDGITTSTTELNYVDGVTSSIQGQLDGKQPVSGISSGGWIASYPIGSGYWGLKAGGADEAYEIEVGFPYGKGGTVGVFDDPGGRPNLNYETVGDLPIARLSGVGGLSILGRSATTGGSPTDITAMSDGQVLRRNGAAIGFGALNLANANAVTGALPVANGGTGATSASAARTNLGLAIGTDVQAYHANLAAIAGLTDPDADCLLFWDDSAGSYAHLSLGNNLSITGTTLNAAGGGSGDWGDIGGDLSDQTDLQNALDAKQDLIDSLLVLGDPITPGELRLYDGSSGFYGTILQNATANRAFFLPDADGTLALTSQIPPSGSGGYQPYDATLNSIASLGTAANRIAYTTGVDTWAETVLSAFGRTLIDDDDAAAARATLGLGESDFVSFYEVNAAESIKSPLVSGTTKLVAGYPSEASHMDVLVGSIAFADETGTGFTGTLVFPNDITGNRTWTLPSITGTVALTSQIPASGSGGYLPYSDTTTYTRTLLDDVDSAAARATLELGSLATLNSINNSNWSGTALADENIASASTWNGKQDSIGLAANQFYARGEAGVAEGKSIQTWALNFLASDAYFANPAAGTLVFTGDDGWSVSPTGFGIYNEDGDEALFQLDRIRRYILGNGPVDLMLPGVAGTLALTSDITPPSKTIATFTPRDNQPPNSSFATGSTRNSISTLRFDEAVEEAATFVSVIPDGAVLTSGLSIRITWTGATATSGAVRWGVQLMRLNTAIDSDSYDSAAETTTTTNATSGIPETTTITLTTIDGVTVGDTYRLRVYRDTSDDGDTMTGDAELLSVEVRTVD